MTAEPVRGAPPEQLRALGFRYLPARDDGGLERRPGPRLDDMRARAAAFAGIFGQHGPVRGVRTVDLLPFPYPVGFGFWQTPPTTAKYLLMRNRLNLVE